LTSRIRFTVDDRIAQLVLASPPLNALDFACLEELAELVRDTLPRLDVAGLVVSGEGRHFSSGADIPGLTAAFANTPEHGKAFVSTHLAALAAIEALPYPTVAAISGSCLGAALELALSCRFRVAARRAVLALPETQFGMMPGLGGITRLAALVGRARAIEIALTGRTVDADEALAVGLVDDVVDRRDLQGAAASLVRRGARGPIDFEVRS
jgi:enoyl-CoA hydratase